MTRTEWCRDHIDEIEKNCGLAPITKQQIKRAIGYSNCLKPSFCEISLLTTETVLEIGKKRYSEILDRAIPKLREKVNEDRLTTIVAKEILESELKEYNLERSVKTENEVTSSTELEEEIDFVDKRPQKTDAKFNLTNDNIEWSPFTWNPVTGCKYGCKYCYARDIANRFYEVGFEPTFHPERLCAPENTKPNGYLNNVFVCSMADLFGEWVPQEWIDAILREVKNHPEWNFIFLTKNPKRLTTISFPINAWVGTTIDTQSRVKLAEESFKNVKATVKFVSIEPMMEHITFKNIEVFNWIIIGGRSASTDMPEGYDRASNPNAGQPKWEWVEDVMIQARKKGLKVYFKPNLTIRPKEYP